MFLSSKTLPMDNIETFTCGYAKPGRTYRIIEPFPKEKNPPEFGDKQLYLVEDVDSGEYAILAETDCRKISSSPTEGRSTVGRNRKR